MTLKTAALVILLVLTQTLSLEFKSEGSRGHARGRSRITSIIDILKRNKRAVTYATLKVINRTGREVHLVYMNYYRNPTRYTTLRRNEKKSFRSRIYTTWYAYDNTMSNYMLMNGKPSFLVLKRHADRVKDIIIQSKDGRAPSLPQRVFREKYIELMVLADSTMYEKYGDETEKYVLTIVNQGRGHFFDESLGIKINVVVTRVEIIKDKKLDFKVEWKRPIQNMRIACNFALRFNFPSDDDDRHFDFAVIFTRKKFGYSGYTPIFQMCRDSLSCTLVHDKGFALAHVVAHEIGHSLGIDHDGQHNNCSSDGLLGSIMGKVLYSRMDNYYWSRCSREQLMQTIGYFYCLNDKPRVNVTRHMSNLPGVVMDRKEQCQYRYAKHYTACLKTTHPHFDCKATYCAPNWDPHLCAYHSRPPLDGSKCNRGKGWCVKGHCYPYGRFKYNPIDGGWSTWKSWEGCSAACGIGVRYRRRKCNNPRPKHDGKQCPGSEKEMKACRLKSCAVVETVKDARDNYCKSLKSKDWIWFTEKQSIETLSATEGLNCTFEANCSWTESVNDEFNWTRHSGRTPSYGTGPFDDHTYRNDSGHYLFIEASTGNGDARRKKGFKARLVSPLIHVPQVCFRFYYHMLGSHLGSLRVYKRDEDNEVLLWKRTEDKGNAWLEGEVEIENSKSFAILVEAVRGSHYQGDIAIDDLRVTSGECRDIGNSSSSPCLLSCVNGNRTKFITNLTVPDTYRCHSDGLLDICIAGKCEILGCDLEFGSNKTYDSCKICGGDDLGCRPMKKEETINLNKGDETTLLTIPSKSTNIQVEIATSSLGRIGIRTESSGTYFPGNVDENFPFTKYLALASQTYHFKFNDGVCRITSEGPSSGKLVILMAPSEESHVKLKYSLFKASP